MDKFKKNVEAFKEVCRSLAATFRFTGEAIAKGSWKVKASAVIFGFGHILRKQFLRGFAFLAGEAALLWVVFGFGWQYISKFASLGDSSGGYNPDGTISYGDNSFFILLYGILVIIAIVGFFILWGMNLRDSYRCEKRLAEGRKLPTSKEDWHSLFDKNFAQTLLTIPVIGIFVFTVLPILFMICIAFTNYDKDHTPPAALFDWVGFENFRKIFDFGGAGLGSTFFKVLGWTLCWAFFATFLNYFLGMGVAILINRNGIKFKKFWRTILVMTIAVPQIVSLLYIGKLFATDGLINLFLMNHGIIDRAIPFWTDANYARVLIILINLWVGIPYMMLIATGLLMNIPADLYESARIDGANSFQMFRKITLPYMLFVTGPFLLTSFTGNLNNFNVIYLLNKGQPKSMSLSDGAGATDLLVTWLYTVTVTNNDYKIAAVIGIMIFIVTAVIALVVYGMLPSVKDEEGFQ
ncbi:MAG: sugar ABC transporter permease [Lachnospiraceae bacterium]|nr:sugar ABC transporter permease [Lachnospiraceae bacterium]